MREYKTTTQTAADIIARATAPERIITAWKETANGTLRADCPFNEEKPGNLFIYPDDPSIFTCFGCGSRGTAAKVKEGYLLRAGACALPGLPMAIASDVGDV